MLEYLLTCKEGVAELLEKYPELRDSDRLLWLAYLCKYHGLKQTIGEEAYQKLKTLLLDKKTPSEKSIVRIRCKFQSDGFWRGPKWAKRASHADDVNEHFAEDLRENNPDFED